MFNVLSDALLQTSSMSISFILHSIVLNST